MLALNVSSSGDVNSPAVPVSPGIWQATVDGSLNSGTLTLKELPSPSLAADQLDVSNYTDIGSLAAGSTQFRAAGGHVCAAFSGTGATFSLKIVPAEPGIPYNANTPLGDAVS